MRSLPQVSPLWYVSYAALVGCKRLLHLPQSGHRRFFLLQLVRALNTGRIGPGCHITVANRLDGVGAQAQAQMSTMCLAHAYGLQYVHSPFVTLAHAEGPPAQWVATWEARFNFGDGELRIDQVDLPQWDLETFVANRSLWREPCVLVVRHCHAFCDLQPDAYYGIILRLREKYNLGQVIRRVSPVTEVCVHVRRGDVACNDVETSHRYTSDRNILNTVRRLQQVLSERKRPYRIRVFSQGAADSFQCFAELGCELCLNQPTLETFQELVAADVLVMARSAFSYAAALLGRGIKLYDPQRHAPLSDWLVLDRASGTFDAGRLAVAMDRLA